MTRTTRREPPARREQPLPQRSRRALPPVCPSCGRLAGCDCAPEAADAEWDLPYRCDGCGVVHPDGRPCPCMGGFLESEDALDNR